MTLTLAPLDQAPDLVDQVYHALMQAISSGQLAAGERLTQEDLARRFAVSRQPVLQALRLLKKDGLVLDAPGRGLWVAPLNRDGIASVYQVRGALDALAAGLAAQRQVLASPIEPAGDAPSLSATLQQLLKQGRNTAALGDVRAMIDADLAFHSAIYAASGNPLIQPSAELHWCQVRRGMAAALQFSTLREAVWDEHQAIADAILQGDAQRAQQLAQTHAYRACEHMTRTAFASADNRMPDPEAPAAA